jgi:hypothetical protein
MSFKFHISLLQDRIDLSFRRKDDVVGKLEGGFWVALKRDKVHYEVVLDCEDGISR